MSFSFPEDLKNKHILYKKGLPINQIAALNQYINNYSDFNILLRDGFNVRNEEHCKFYGNEMTQRVKNMDNALSGNELENLNKKWFNGSGSFLVYRGINSQNLGKMLELNGYIHHPHFMSTSIQRDVASKMFAGSECCLFEIKVDATSPNFLYISKEGSTTETEVLFERNTYLVYQEKRLQGNQQVYVVSISKDKPAVKLNSIQKKQNSNSISTEIVIDRNTVEDELAFYDDITNENINTVVEEITESLHKAFSYIDRNRINKDVVRIINEIRKENGQTGGAYKSRRRSKK
jgi:hypothetical protein